MKQRFEVSVQSTVEGYDVLVDGGEDYGTSRVSARSLDQALRAAAAWMASCGEEALNFP